MTASLYDRLGGFKTVRKAVSDFYDRVLDEDDLSPYFAETDMASLIDHQTKFISALLGGPASYTNDQLRHIHKGKRITAHEFGLVCELLIETLEDHDLEEDDISQVEGELLARKDCIVQVSQ